MQVRVMVGPKAGTIMGIVQEAALAMLADGRAVPAFGIDGVEIPMPGMLVSESARPEADTSAIAESKPASARAKGAKR